MRKKTEPGKKRLRLLSAILLLCIVVLGVSVTASASVSSAKSTAKKVKNGWVKKTYYYKKGKMLKNKWLTIGKTKYYFGKNGKVTKGVAVIKGKFYYFNKSNGKWNQKKTKQLQAAAKYEKSFAKLRKLLGKPKKSRYLYGCYGKGKDGILTYSGFTVYTYKEGKKELYMGAE